MRLKNLTLDKIVDAVYFCGLDNTPVSVVIAAPSGAGKTWSTYALAETIFVQYINKPYSPSEHRKLIARHAARTRLLINDDLSLTARWNAKEYFATFCMVHDGEIRYTQFNSSLGARMNCSMILCCTKDYYHANSDNMESMGLMDRIIPVLLNLSNETRKKYQDRIKEMDLPDNTPKPRDPILPDTAITKRDLLSKEDIDPRLLLNLLRVSRYLTEEETEELVNIAHSNPGVYEV